MEQDVTHLPRPLDDPLPFKRVTSLLCHFKKFSLGSGLFWQVNPI